MTVVTHLAGAAIHFDAHVRQRCEWCGYVLIDQDLTQIAVLVEDADKPFPTWPAGGLVEVDAEDADGHAFASRMFSVVEPELGDDGITPKAPENSCLRLPPEMTLAVAGPDN